MVVTKDSQAQNAAVVPPSSAVMGLCGAAALIALGGLAGCKSAGPGAGPSTDISEEFEHCTPNDPASWRIIAPPSDAKEILALPMEKGTLDTELAPGGSGREKVHEHWFSSGDSRLAVCRHLAVSDSCYSNSTLIYLTKANGGWAAPDGVLVSVCLVHERAR